MPLPMVQEKNRKEKCKVLAVAAGKGGVGKSTLTANLARAFQRMGLKVGVLDADLYGPSLRKMLPEQRLPRKEGETLIPALCEGIKLLSMAYFRKEEEASIVRAPIANGIIQSFVHQAAWGELDILLVDFPPGTGDIQLTLAQTANLSGALMVTTPQEVALADVKKAAHLFSQVNVSLLGIVENMSYFEEGETEIRHHIFGEGGGERLALTLGVPYLGEIPLLPSLAHACDRGEDLYLSEPEKCEIFSTLATKLFGQLLQESAPTVKAFAVEGGIAVEWPGGDKKKFLLSDLQNNCPCASCVDEATGERIPRKQPENAPELVKIEEIGRYGIRLHYSSGCSGGIWSFDHLRSQV